mmetsp:Transcript_20049/g.46689  ORF Transcript_20049/g.46689 Transcript_20049/m.46689 type:complete len:105 (-) Transcript_20049:501-815(-)
MAGLSLIGRPYPAVRHNGVAIGQRAVWRRADATAGGTLESPLVTAAQIAPVATKVKSSPAMHDNCESITEGACRLGARTSQFGAHEGTVVTTASVAPIRAVVVP